MADNERGGEHKRTFFERLWCVIWNVVKWSFLLLTGLIDEFPFIFTLLVLIFYLIFFESPKKEVETPPERPKIQEPQVAQPVEKKVVEATKSVEEKRPETGKKRAEKKQLSAEEKQKKQMDLLEKKLILSEFVYLGGMTSCDNYVHEYNTL